MTQTEYNLRKYPEHLKWAVDGFGETIVCFN